MMTINRVEPQVHDVDFVDSRIMDEATNVDWDKVSKPDAASFGLTLGLFRDAAHVDTLRAAAFYQSLGNFISLAALAAVCGITDLGKYFIAVVLVHQAIRTLSFLWRKRAATKHLHFAEDHAVEEARSLAHKYQANGTPVA